MIPSPRQVTDTYNKQKELCISTLTCHIQSKHTHTHTRSHFLTHTLTQVVLTNELSPCMKLSSHITMQTLFPISLLPFILTQPYLNGRQIPLN